ncbi:nuclear envelope integral membrane protein-like [Phlebotomus argentipes]|uniref:nuclear envelope integral membrane protein-like n=1 Tax=Phlebotomus argentipes TaxID=94469 RepID=UPI0028937C19|nr:nuclear envelope integral membrane protein-like [Phlebotomus argentipes]
MWALLVIKLLAFFLLCDGKNAHNVNYLEPGSALEVSSAPNSLGFTSPRMNIFCYRGRPKYAPHLFHTVNFLLDITTEDFVQYVGSTPEEVQSHRESQKSIFSFNFGFSRKRNLELHPFNQTCVGVESSESYKVHLHLIRFDLYKVSLLCLGAFLLFSASRLSENSLFYYLCGVSLGICASFLLLVYFVSKLLPRKPLMYGMMIGGWGLGLYFGQLLWDNIQMILVSYQTYALWYVMIMGFLSFVICYRYGPPKDQRSKDLIKWGLQMLAICIVYQCSHYTELVLAINMLLVLIYYFPKSWMDRSRSYYQRKFPKKRRLLTTEEYNEEGVRETTRALEELRRYCSSPECKQWNTMLRLRDPSRFASFMEGSSHILDSETLEYDTTQADISEDENSDNDNNEISEDDSEGEEIPNVPNGTNRWNRSRGINSSAVSNNGSFRTRGANRHFHDN